MIEKVIFYILAFVIFITIFGKMIKRNDTIYIYLLVLEFLGIAIRFIDIINNLNLNWIIIALLYVITIVLPFIVILLERKKLYLSEMICVFKAKTKFKSGKNSTARRKLISLISKYPNSYYAHKLLAQIYEKEGKDEESIDEYVKAVELNVKDYYSYYQIAFLLNKTEKKNEAEKMLRNLLSKKPDYYNASELLGNILYDKEEFKQATAIYLEALKYHPEKYELYYGLGMMYTRLNDFQAAKEYYEKAAQINSMIHHAKINIAQIILIAGELEEAENKFIDCLQDKQTEPYAYYYLAVISMIKGESERAISYINMAIELDFRFYKKACKQEVFASIVKYIRENQTKDCKYNLTYREIKTIKHLDDTFSLIQKMKCNNDKQKAENEKVLDDINEREY